MVKDVPLTARLGDDVIVSVDLTDDEWAALPRAASKGPGLACTSCGWPMSPRQQHGRTRHFFHRSGADCPFTGESEVHTRLKLLVREACRAAGWWAEVEVPGKAPDGRPWRADVLARLGGREVVFEVQKSPQTPAATEDRTFVRAQAGCEVVWLFPVDRDIPGDDAFVQVEMTLVEELGFLCYGPRTGVIDGEITGVQAESVAELVGLILARAVEWRRVPGDQCRGWAWMTPEDHRLAVTLVERREAEERRRAEAQARRDIQRARKRAEQAAVGRRRRDEEWRARRAVEEAHAAALAATCEAETRALDLLTPMMHPAHFDGRDPFADVPGGRTGRSSRPVRPLADPPPPPTPTEVVAFALTAIGFRMYGIVAWSGGYALDVSADARRVTVSDRHGWSASFDAALDPETLRVAVSSTVNGHLRR